MNQGISSAHGVHHVAQKLRRTTLPLKSASLTARPLGSFSLKAGAGTRPATGRTSAERVEVMTRQATAVPSANRISDDFIGKV